MPAPVQSDRDALDDVHLDVERFTEPQAFLDEAGPFLAEHEAEHNLIFGIAATLIVDPDRYRDPPYLATIKGDGDVVAAAVMTPPFNVVVSMSDDPEAVVALGHDLGRNRISVPGVTGPVDVASQFADLWAERHGLLARKVIEERIYRLERVTHPTGVGGATRIATPDDRELLVEWMRDFLLEALHGQDPDEAELMVDSALEAGTRTFYLWEDAGQPVSVAGVTGPTPNGIRVGPVYTPPEVRRRGYASALTAAASQAQLDAGKRFVFLFTDLANPTSNRIYQAIGYEPVIDVDQWTFEPATRR